MTAPMTPKLDEARLRELAEAEARLREEIDGYRVAAEIERGVMWSIAPYVEQWNADRSSGRSGIDMLTRFVRENSSSRSNAERMDRLANDTQLVLAALSAERERADRAVGLADYAAHDDDCTVNRYPGHDACSCGLSPILQSIRHDPATQKAED